MKRGRTNLSYLTCINKANGETSSDVVVKVKRLLGESRVGHGGTLDPAASGVLPLMVGPATKLMQYFSYAKKTYEATIQFGTSTDTQDAEGKVTGRCSVPAEVEDMNFAREVLKNFIGEIVQTPPEYSALKINGKKAYEFARKGESVALKERKVRVFSAQLLDIFSNHPRDEFHDIGADNSNHPRDEFSEPLDSNQNHPRDEFLSCDDKAVIWKVRFSVSSGTYIRTLASDIGKKCNTLAHLCELKRTSVGNLSVDDCVNSTEIFDKNLPIIDPCQALDFPIYNLSKSEVKKVKNGMTIPCDRENFVNIDTKFTHDLIDAESKIPIFMASEDEVLAVYYLTIDMNLAKPSSVFNIGVKRK